MTSNNSLLIPVVCKRCKANLASLSKRESDLDNDGNYFDDRNEGEEDGDDESDDDLEVTIAAKHLVFQKEVRKFFTIARRKFTAMPFRGRIENINWWLYGLTRTRK